MFDIEPSVNIDGVELVMVPHDGIACHAELACLENEPCISLHDGVNEENVISVVIHETLHHVLFNLGADNAPPNSQNTVSDEVLDKVWPTVTEMRTEEHFHHEALL